MKTKKIKEVVNLINRMMSLYEDTGNAIDPNESAEVTLILYSIFLFPHFKATYFVITFFKYLPRFNVNFHFNLD